MPEDHNHSATTTALQRAEEYAAQQGYILSSADRAAIGEIQTTERARLAQLHAAEQTGLIARFNAFYPRLLESIAGVGDVMITLVQTLLVTFGVPIALYLLMRVEVTRVTHGLQLFETDTQIAEFGATALVIVNLILEFVAEFIEHRDGYKQERASQFSLRLVAGNARYFLGIGSNWQRRPLSPAQWAKSVLFIITWTILALALFGSMRDVMARVAGNWKQALWSILTTSTLAQMAQWIGGLLFAVAAVLTAQRLSRYMAIRCAEIIDHMRANAAGVDAQADAQAEHSAAQYLIATVRAAKQAQRASARNVPQAPQFAPMGTNGGNGESEAPKRLSVKMQKALDHLRNTPDAMQSSNLALANLLEVSEETVRKAKQQVMGEESTKPMQPIAEETV